MLRLFKASYRLISNDSQLQGNANGRSCESILPKAQKAACWTTFTEMG